MYKNNYNSIFMVTDNVNKVMKVLFDSPTQVFHIRELSRITHLNPNTIINILRILCKDNLVNKTEKKHVVEISLNLNNPETIYKKRVSNIERIYSSGIINFLVNKYSPSSISILGSYSKGEDVEKSDVDIAVITNNKEQADLERFEKKLNRKVHLLLLETKETSEEFFNNLINGVIFYGVLRK